MSSNQPIPTASEIQADHLFVQRAREWREQFVIDFRPSNLIIIEPYFSIANSSIGGGLNSAETYPLAHTSQSVCVVSLSTKELFDVVARINVTSDVEQNAAQRYVAYHEFSHCLDTQKISKEIIKNALYKTFEQDLISLSSNEKTPVLYEPFDDKNLLTLAKLLFQEARSTSISLLSILKSDPFLEGKQMNKVNSKTRQFLSQLDFCLENLYPALCSFRSTNTDLFHLSKLTTQEVIQVAHSLAIRNIIHVIVHRAIKDKSIQENQNFDIWKEHFTTSHFDRLSATAAF
jgi:hypothetical protein